MNSEIAGSKSSNTYGQASRGQRGGKEKKQSELLLEGMFQPHTTNTAGINDQELLSVWMQGKFTERVLALIG